MRIATIGAALLIISCFVGSAMAQDAPPKPPNICQESPEFNQWDFWLGDWNVYSNNEERTLFGTNSITKHYANCLVQESWMDAAGNGGFSMNFFNPVRGHWRQVWVSNGYFIDYTGGLNDQGQMVLEGESDEYVANKTTRFRGIWTPEDNGDVIQRFDTFDTASNEWKTVFEARYVRQ